MDDILLYNKYIDFFTTLYNYISESKDKELSELIEPSKYKKFIRQHRCCSINTQKRIIIHDEVIKKLDSFIEEECAIEDMLSFGSLWRFCQFVRYAEKTIFYENTLDQDFYVDSDMYEVSERSFQLKSIYEVEVLFKLEKTRDKVNNEEFKVITLNVKRLYGKQMMNTFTIVNEDVKFNDSSDLYLINTINNFLYRELLATLKNIVNTLEAVNNIEWYR